MTEKYAEATFYKCVINMHEVINVVVVVFLYINKEEDED